MRLLARSDASAWRAEENAQSEAKKIDGAAPERIKVTTAHADLAECDVIVEAIAEDHEAKAELLTILAGAAECDLATTTSSLSITELGGRSGAPERFFGLHVFNPVARMELVELCFPTAAAAAVRERALELVSAAREDGDRGSRPARVRRQPAAVPVPVRGRAADGGKPDERRRRRCLHAAGRRAPDGAAGATRLRRPRRRRRDRREPGPGSRRRGRRYPACSARWSPRASSGASPEPDFTSTR